MRDWAVWQAKAGFYSQAALSSNDSKTLYLADIIYGGSGGRGRRGRERERGEEELIVALISFPTTTDHVLQGATPSIDHILS